MAGTRRSTAAAAAAAANAANAATDVNGGLHTRHATSEALDSQSPLSSGSSTPESSPGPRRSMRTGALTDQPMPDRGAGIQPRSKRTQNAGAGPGDESPAPSSQEVQQIKEMAQQGVKDAINDLARMERRLKRNTKRQKLQVAKSLEQESQQEPVEDAPFLPRPTRNPDPAVDSKEKKPHLLTPELDVADHEVQGVGNEDALGKKHVDGPQAGPDLTPDRGAGRMPPVNSDYLPLPWKGRLGYACLNTYLRNANPPVFCSRTCRLASIVEHRHPLQDPLKPEHTTKNRPDKTQLADPELGLKFVQGLGLANARDIVKMIKWNDKYGIKFMRLSSEMFPFASHAEHGYKLAPFATDVLADAGRVIAALGHRVTTHPGQFTQLGSPRKEVVTAAVRDLEYHDEMLSLLKLPPQQDRDAVMILHMGGTFGDKAATLERFRANYKSLPSGVKQRLVLENDDVGWSVHDLLPICEELNIPLVLDYHHHNIVFDATQVREGTYDISQPKISQRIADTWRRKSIKQKMHYSEPTAAAVTPRDRRKHSPRVWTLPPCPPDTDLMIEAKDKEQAVFELMRTFKLPGFDRINPMVPNERDDEVKPGDATPKRKKQKPKAQETGAGKRRKKEDSAEEEAIDILLMKEEEDAQEVPQPNGLAWEDFAMGGPMNRVYWPQGMEDWLKVRKKDLQKVKSIVMADAES